ncbi:hypothetical protein [Streptomyces sp. NPDC006645]|uniref:hypothetical protein n=1 Tax=unclassified Streptomyces TaxID=2593676 RepID=UPI0033A8DBB1
MKTMRGLADSMLERLLPRETAGACYWIHRCIKNQTCSNFSQYTQRVWSCNLNQREFLYCGCS